MKLYLRSHFMWAIIHKERINNKLLLQCHYSKVILAEEISAQVDSKY